MANHYPQTFSSLQEYKIYLRCKKKLKVGSKVRIFVDRSYRKAISPQGMLAKSDIIDVVAFCTKTNEFVLGSMHDIGLGFWPKDNLSIFNVPDRVAYFSHYEYLYYVRDSDVRLAEIIQP